MRHMANCHRLLRQFLWVMGVAGIMQVQADAQTTNAATNDYPTGPIRLLVGYAAGGASDSMARAVARALSLSLHQFVVVKVWPDTAGNAAAQRVSRASPDGYTLLLGMMAVSANPAQHPRATDDLLKNLAPVSEVATAPFILAATASSGIRSVPDLIQKAQAAHPPLTYASPGTGSGANLLMEEFKARAGIDLAHIPDIAVAPELTDMDNGRIPLSFDNIMTMMPPIRQGKFVALAISTPQRSPLAPGVVPLATYIPGFDASAWFGVFAPAATPVAIIEKLNAALVHGIQRPEILKKFKMLGAQPVTSTPDAFRRLIEGRSTNGRPSSVTSVYR